MTELLRFAPWLLSYLVTYLLHSTLLLGGCWLLITLARPGSHALRERMWKYAAILGFVTAGLQLASPMTSPAAISAGSEPAGVVSTETAEPIQSGPSRPATDAPLVDATPLPSRTTANLAAPNTVMAQPNRTDFAADANEPRPGNYPLSTVGHPEPSAFAIDPAFTTMEDATQSKSPTSIDPVAHQSVTVPTTTEDSPAVVVGAAIEGRSTATPRNSARQHQLLAGALVMAAAVAGLILLLGGVLLLIQSLRLRRRFANATLVTGPMRRALDRLLRKQRVRRRVALFQADDCVEPVAFGLVRWTIVVPAGIDTRLSKEEVQALLAHEVAHLVRGDVRWLWIGRVLCGCFGFQPLNFVARRSWQQAAEYLCDDWAITSGVRSLTLARCLTRIAELRFGEPAAQVGLAAGGSRATLVQRVERLVEDQCGGDTWERPGRRRLLTLASLVVVFATVLLVPRIVLPASELFDIADVEPTPTASPTAAVTEEATSIESEDKPHTTQAPEELTHLPHSWRSVEEELLQLDADLARAKQLSQSAAANRETQALLHRMDVNAAKLRERRHRIDSSFRKDSER